MRSSALHALLAASFLLAACEPSTTTTPTPNQAGGRPDPDRMVLGGDCPTAPAAGVSHTTEITADETWRASDGPHRVPNGIRVLATLTIEPCVTVVLGDRATIQVGSSSAKGAIVAKGEKTTAGLRPVRFIADDVDKPWGSVSVDVQGSLDLSYTLLADAANPASAQNGGGALLVYGETPKSTEDPTPKRSVKTTWLQVENPRGFGLNFVRYGGFADGADGVIVRGAKDAPIAIELASAGTMPTNVELTGNVRDEIDLDTSGSVPSSTIKAVGHPYHVRRAVYVASAVDGNVATLTVEAGVTLRFDSATNASGMYLGSTDKRQGVLVAKGTIDKPIVFTSAKKVPAPADWMGLYFRYSPANANAIENAVIEWAGAPSGAQGFGCGPANNDASVLILSGRPESAFIKSTAFKNGGGDTGIVLGWKSDQSGPDFKSPNTFTAMPTCAVSQWRRADNSCPSSQPTCL